jgi:hypothetical protein
MENTLKEVQEIVNTLKDEVGNISDGFHSFNELYEFRKLYNALLFNEWAKNCKVNYEWVKNDSNLLTQKVKSTEYKYDIHKSIRHNNGELCFGGGWFVVVAILPSGQITNHYEMKDWDLFNIPEVEKAKYEFDGHSSKDVLERMLNLITQ